MFRLSIYSFQTWKSHLMPVFILFYMTFTDYKIHTPYRNSINFLKCTDLWKKAAYQFPSPLPTVIATVNFLFFFSVCMGVCVCVLCVWERERERESADDCKIFNVSLNLYFCGYQCSPVFFMSSIFICLIQVLSLLWWLFFSWIVLLSCTLFENIRIFTYKSFKIVLNFFPTFIFLKILFMYY